MKLTSFIGVKEVAKRCGLRPSQVWGYVQRGKFPSPERADGARPVWSIFDVEAWIAKRTISDDAALGALPKCRKYFSELAPLDIKKLRHRLGMSQAALAEELRIGAFTVSLWERGVTQMSASMELLLKLIVERHTTSV